MTAIPAARSSDATTSGAPRPLTLRGRLRRIWRSYWFKVIFQGLVTIWAVMTLTFFMIRQMPGNPFEIRVDELMNRQGLSYEDAVRAAATIFNFDPDRPALLQYTDYITDLVQGDLGMSITKTGTPVAELLLRYLPWTLFSIGLALVISFTLGIVIGLTIGYWRGSWFDNVITTLASIISGIPDYIIALLIILIFGVQLEWFKIGQVRGGVDPTITPGLTLEYVLSILQYAFMPILIYTLSSVGTWILAMKSSTISTLGEDYITVAQARGLPQRRILATYVGRNAMLPLITRLAISVGFIVGGSVIIEEMFQYPGLGRNLYIAISGRDYTVMQGIFLVITVAVVASNILADLAVAWLDPRVRLDKGGE
ncbi:MAG: ABC transporter permease [Chloroflexi bacterium]|nr:ABC transporter permease [Chloroflexota bacterium]